MEYIWRFNSTPGLLFHIYWERVKRSCGWPYFSYSSVALQARYSMHNCNLSRLWNKELWLLKRRLVKRTVTMAPFNKSLTEQILRMLPSSKVTQVSRKRNSTFDSSKVFMQWTHIFYVFFQSSNCYILRLYSSIFQRNLQVCSFYYPLLLTTLRVLFLHLFSRTHFEIVVSCWYLHTFEFNNTPYQWIFSLQTYRKVAPVSYNYTECNAVTLTS